MAGLIMADDTDPKDLDKEEGGGNYKEPAKTTNSPTAASTTRAFNPDTGKVETVALGAGGNVLGEHSYAPVYSEPIDSPDLGEGGYTGIQGGYTGIQGRQGGIKTDVGTGPAQLASVVSNTASNIAANAYKNAWNTIASGIQANQVPEWITNAYSNVSTGGAFGSHDPNVVSSGLSNLGMGTPVTMDASGTATSRIQQNVSPGDYGPVSAMYKDWMSNAPTVKTPAELANLAATQINSQTGAVGAGNYTGAANTAAANTAQTQYQTQYSPEQLAQLRSAQAGNINLGLLQSLAQQAQGIGGPSAAQQQLQQATDKNIAAMQAQAVAQRGQFNPALMRAITAQSAQARQEAAGQSAVLRAQEQQAAQQAAAQLGTTMTGQQIQAISKENELKTAVAQGNTQAINQTMSDIMKDSTIRDTQNAKNLLDAAMANMSEANKVKIQQAQSLTDIAKVDAQLASNIATSLLDGQLKADQQIRQGLIAAGMSDADADRQLKMFNQQQNNDRAKFTIDLITRAKEDDANATFALEQAKTQLRQYWEQKGFNKEQVDRQWAIELETLKQNQQRINQGEPVEPSMLDRLIAGSQVIGGAIMTYYGGGAVGVPMMASGAKGLTQTSQPAPTYSDKTVKNNIKGAKVLSFLEAIKPVSFEYKGEYGPKGKRYGFLAQDLAKTKEGASIINKDQDGKMMIDTQQGFGLLLAALAELNKKVDKMGSK